MFIMKLRKYKDTESLFTKPIYTTEAQLGVCHNYKTKAVILNQSLATTVSNR